MEIKIEPSWKHLLNEEFNKPYFHHLTKKVKLAYEREVCFPAIENIFAAFNLCPVEKTKVVIIGQDPYHGAGQANGLSFSVKNEIPHPPSLINIFKEIQSDLGLAYPKSGDLSRWAKQGVLLLNGTLTVQQGLAGSHQNMGWETFTDNVIHTLAHTKSDLIFLLWGGFAHKKEKFINLRHNHVLKAGHPSPLSANRGYWFGNRHFSKTNKILHDVGKNIINWS